MGTKYLRYQNQEAIHFDQVLKGEAVTLSNKDGIKFIKKKIVPQEGGLIQIKLENLSMIMLTLVNILVHLIVGIMLEEFGKEKNVQFVIR